jgi:hypothetical protein
VAALGPPAAAGQSRSAHRLERGWFAASGVVVARLVGQDGFVGLMPAGQLLRAVLLRLPQVDGVSRADLGDRPLGAFDRGRGLVRGGHTDCVLVDLRGFGGGEVADVADGCGVKVGVPKLVALDGGCEVVEVGLSDLPVRVFDRVGGAVCIEPLLGGDRGLIRVGFGVPGGQLGLGGCGTVSSSIRETMSGPAAAAPAE